MLVLWPRTGLNQGDVTSVSSLKEYGSKGEEWHLYNRDSQTLCASDDVINIFIHLCNQQVCIEHLLCGGYHSSFHGAEGLDGERDGEINELMRSAGRNMLLQERAREGPTYTGKCEVSYHG